MTPGICASGEHPNPSIAPQYIVQAADACNDPTAFRLASIEIAIGNIPALELTSALWYAYRLNGSIASIATGNYEGPQGRTSYPGALPFALGVSGFTWTGEYYSHETNCLGDADGGAYGPMNVDISGPASGWAWGFCANPDTPFCPTNLATSGASAAVAGAIALLRSYWADEIGETTLPSPGFLAGFITGSALDYSQDPTSYPDLTCPTCTRDDYGPGRLNVAGALRLLEIYHNPIPGAWILLRTLGYADHDSIIHDTAEWSAGDTLFRANTIYWTIEAPEMDEPFLPGHVAFLIPELSHVYPHIATSNTQPDTFTVPQFQGRMMSHCVRNGIPGGHMGVFDSSGRTRAWGDYYRYSLDDGLHWSDYGWSVENMQLTYAFLNENGAGLDDIASRSLDLAFPTPSAPPVALRIAGASPKETRVEVFDVSGRLVMTLTPESASADFVWSGERAEGTRAPSGVYFVRAAHGGRAVVKRLTVVR